MKTNVSNYFMNPKVSKWLTPILGIAVGGMVGHQIEAATLTVDLKTADNFAILAGSEITDAGGSKIVTGDVGVYPGTSNGLLASQVIGGAIRARPGDDGLLLVAKNDLTTAYVDAGGRSATVAYGDIDNQLGNNQTLLPGVYSFGHAATANLIGNLTLDGNGEVDPVWIFQATVDLIVQSGSSVTLINGATSCDVFWWVASSATIGTDTQFVGNIMADQSIALQTRATLDGSALARSAAVTLDDNRITDSVCDDGGGDDDGGDDDDGNGHSVPETGSSIVLLGSTLASLLVVARRGKQNKKA